MKRRDEIDDRIVADAYRAREVELERDVHARRFTRPRMTAADWAALHGGKGPRTLEGRIAMEMAYKRERRDA